VNSKIIHEFLSSWNPAQSKHLKYVQIEDDIRDGIQGAYTRKPSLEEKKELLELTASVGAHEMRIKG